jgi:DNA-binding NarL/FixJ family response regulator
MLLVLLVSEKNTALSGIESGLKQYDDVSLLRADSCRNALDMVSEKAPDLVVVDETIGKMTGFDFIKKLVSIRPTTNTAVVSTLSTSEFHEASEGLGVLMQLPENPDEKDADRLIGRLTEIMNLTYLS